MTWLLGHLGATTSSRGCTSISRTSEKTLTVSTLAREVYGVLRHLGLKILLLTHSHHLGIQTKEERNAVFRRTATHSATSRSYVQ